MTKRYGNFQHTNGKKPKLDDDEPWGDDINDELLDKCFEIATQKFQDEINQTQSRNNSILPSYDAFKNPAVFSSSTQANITVTASTSNKRSFHELEAELQRLQEQNKEKDGEICILRSKIKDSSKVVQVEQQKTVSEWREKLHSTQREAILIKSELEFKNLEIANLRQQLTESRRLTLDATLNNTQQFVVPEPVVKVNHERLEQLYAKLNKNKNVCTYWLKKEILFSTCFLYLRPKTPPKKDHIKELLHKEAIVECFYPLKCISPKSFEDTKENHVIKNTSYNISRNTIPYLQNQQTYNESCFHHKCAKIGNRRISLNCIYPEILTLVNCTSEELNGESSFKALNKVLFVGLILLQDLDEYLVEFGSHLRTEDIQQADTSYLIDEKEARYTSTKVCDNELGIQSGKVLEVLSKLILYNSYLADFICGKKSLNSLPSTKEYAKLTPNRHGTIQNDCYLLKLVFAIVKSVGKYRIANRMHSFLMSVVNMLISIGNMNNKSNITELITRNDLFCNLLKEIIFVRPGPKIIERITVLLKICSTEKYFVQYLFRRNNKTPLQKADPKGILFYTEDACSFCVLSIRLQLYLLKTADTSLEVYYNIIVFMYNTFKTSPWIHHENPENVCGCLSQLYKLEMEFMFRALEKFVDYYNKSQKQGILDEWYTFFHHEIIQKVLNQINFNNFELTEKYVIVYSQFKEIEAVLTKKGYTNFTQLNTSEELPKIPSEKFRQDF